MFLVESAAETKDTAGTEQDETPLLRGIEREEILCMWFSNVAARYRDDSEL